MTKHLPGWSTTNTADRYGRLRIQATENRGDFIYFWTISTNTDGTIAPLYRRARIGYCSRKNSGRIFDGSRTSHCCASRHYSRSMATGIAYPRRPPSALGSQTEGSVNSDAVSEHAVPEEGRKRVAPVLAELSADETIPRV